MFKKLMSVCVLSLIAIPSFADSIEDDRAAAVARADKLKAEAKDVLRAAHVRALKSRIAANEMAVRRLKTKAATTKPGDALVALQARIEELDVEVKAMTEESTAPVEVSIGASPTDPAADLVAAQDAAQPAAVAAPRGPFSHIAGVWMTDRVEGQTHTDAVIIDDSGTILTHAGRSLVTGANGAFIVTSGGELQKLQLVRTSATTMRFTGAGARSYTLTRATRAVPPDTVYGGNGSSAHALAKGLDAAHADALREFIKANPLK